MSLVDYLKRRVLRSHNTADLAKERLQIIVAHQRMHRQVGVVNLQDLQLKLIKVIADYLHIDEKEVSVELQRNDNSSVLELNVTLPDQISTARSQAAETVS